MSWFTDLLNVTGLNECFDVWIALSFISLLAGFVGCVGFVVLRVFWPTKPQVDEKVLYICMTISALSALLCSLRQCGTL